MSTVKEIMRKKVVTVSGGDALKKVCEILIKHGLSGTPVVNARKILLGYISEKDIIKSTGKENPLQLKAKEVMTKKVICVKENDLLERVSSIFSGADFKCLPVVRGKKVVGVITRKDVIGAMLGHYY